MAANWIVGATRNIARCITKNYVKSYLRVITALTEANILKEIDRGVSMIARGERRTGALPSVPEYFPIIGSDLIKVSWAHAVNSKSLLEEALNNEQVMMIEADVQLGTLEGQKDVILPIMAHPPAKTSDLSLKMFLDAIINCQKLSKKGVKLDFKTAEAFEKSWPVIDPLKMKIDFPFFLNADIISGPVNSDTIPVDPDTFLSLSVVKFSESTLSLGWTTKFGPGMQGNYSREQLNNMVLAIQKNKIKQPVTLCLRAGIVAQTCGIPDLVDAIDNYQKSNTTSVTIWMSNDSDPVDIPRLKDLIVKLGKKRVYLDVPKFVRDQLVLHEGDEIE